MTISFRSLQSPLVFTFYIKKGIIIDWKFRRRGAQVLNLQPIPIIKTTNQAKLLRQILNLSPDAQFLYNEINEFCTLI